jgi:hypothetical protein
VGSPLSTSAHEGSELTYRSVDLEFQAHLSVFDADSRRILDQSGLMVNRSASP